jgi:hypothetical protein
MKKKLNQAVLAACAASSHYFPFQQLGHTISNSIFCFPFTQPMCPLQPDFQFWTSEHSISFQKSITRDKKSGLLISNHVLELSDSVDIDATDMSATSFSDTSMLQESQQNLLLE